MAKKTEPANQNLADSRPEKDGKPLPGWKQCRNPKCHKWNKGARLGACLDCKTPFPASQAKATPTKSHSVAPTQAPAVKIQPTIEWINGAGGLGKAEAILSQVEGVSQFGGVSKVRHFLEWVQSVGGQAKMEAILAHSEKVYALGGVNFVRLTVSQWKAIRSLPE